MIYCEICGNNRELGPTGRTGFVFADRYILDGSYRELARCVACRSLERERMQAWYLRLNIPNDVKIDLLNVAPNRRLLPWMRRHYPLFNETNVDLTPEKYKFAGAVHKADLTNLHFKDNSFDLILCSHVLEHIPDDVKAASELRRVLRPGGKALFLVPIVNDEDGPIEDASVGTRKKRLEKFGQGDHVRVYDKVTLLDRLTSAGFSCGVFDPFVEDADMATRLGMLRDSFIAVGEKRAE